MPIYQVDCSWIATGSYKIEAENEDAAIQAAYDREELPPQDTYSEDSFNIDGIIEID